MAGIAMEVGSKVTKTEAKSWKSKSLPQLMKQAMEACPWASRTYREFLEKMHRKKSLTFSRDWPKLEEEEEETKEEKLSLKVPWVWHQVIGSYYEEIGFLCWIGELQGLAPFHRDTEHLGRAFFREIEELFSYNTFSSITKDLFGCSDVETYEMMEENIVDLLEQYWEDLNL